VAGSTCSCRFVSCRLSDSLSIAWSRLSDRFCNAAKLNLEMSTNLLAISGKYKGNHCADELLYPNLECCKCWCIGVVIVLFTKYMIVRM